MTSPTQNISPIFEYFQKGQYNSAKIVINNMDVKDLPTLYDDSSNFVHFLIEKNNDESRELLDTIIQKAKNEISKFQNTFPFEYALEKEKFETFHHLVTKNFDLCNQNEISKCLNLIARKGLSNPCNLIVPRLSKENVSLITKGPPSPLMESIRNNHLDIFNIFLQRVPEAIDKKRNILRSLQENGRNILHIICEQPHGLAFLQSLWNQQRPEIIEGELNPGHYFDEIIHEINQSDPNGETLLSLAVKIGQVGLVKKLIQFGADVDISVNGIKPKEIKGISKEMKGVLLDAEYGFIHELQKSPSILNHTTEKRKKQGLIRCCREGKIEEAEKLIKEYDLNPFDSNNLLSDENGNSLLMILLSEKVEVKQIIKFVDLLEKTFQKTIDINQLNGNCDNLLTFAIEKNAKDFVFYLIDKHFHKININHKNNQEQTALTHAAKLEDSTILETIMEKFESSITLSKLKLGKKQQRQGSVVIYSLIKNFQNIQENFQKMMEDLKGKLQFNETELTELKNSHQIELLETQKQLNQEKSKTESLFIKFEEYKIQSEKEVQNKEKEIFLAAIKQNAKTFEYASKNLRKDKEFVLAAIKENVEAFKYAHENLRKDKEFLLAAVNQNGSALQFAHEDLKNDKDVVLAAVKQNGLVLRFAHEDLKNDKDVVFAAFKQDGRVLRFAHEDLKKDKDVVFAACKQDARAFQLAHENFKKDKDVVFAAVKQDGQVLALAHEDLKKDKDVVFAACKQDGRALAFAHEDLKKDKDVVFAAVKQDGRSLEFAHEDLKKDKDVVLAAVKQDSRALEFAHEDLKKDKDVVFAAFKQDGWVLVFAHKDLKKDKEFVLAVVKQDGWVLRFAHETLTKDKDVVFAAVKQDGRVLEFAHEDLKKDKDVVLAAIKQFSLALEFAHEDLKKDKDVVLAAVNQYGRALEFAHEDLKKDKDVVFAAVKQDARAFQLAHENFKKDKDVVFAAVKQDGQVLALAHEDLKKDKDVVLAAVNQYGRALEFAHKDLKKDKDVILAAVKQDDRALDFAHEDLKKTKGFLESIEMNYKVVS